MTHNDKQFCGNCIFSRPKADQDLDCRRNPPMPCLSDIGIVQGYWPKVDWDGWCGEWKEKEDGKELMPSKRLYPQQ